MVSNIKKNFFWTSKKCGASPKWPFTFWQSSALSRRTIKFSFEFTSVSSAFAWIWYTPPQVSLSASVLLSSDRGTLPGNVAQPLFSSNIPTNENGPIMNTDRLRQAAGNGATTERDRSVSLQNEISTNQSSGFEMSGQIAAIAQEKYLKRSTTVGTCQAISQSYHSTNQRPGSSQTVQRQLLAEFNQRNNESESSTSPERYVYYQGSTDKSGRSMTDSRAGYT